MSIKFEDVVLPSAEQWRAIIIGARNPMNSWEKSDSFTCETCKNNIPGYDITMKEECGSCCSWNNKYVSDGTLKLGPNDLSLMKRLCNAGTDHRKFMRMISVIVTITAPLYWWKEFDTYRTGVTPNPMDIEMNSCSTMHKIAVKEFTLEDFSHEHLFGPDDMLKWDERSDIAKDNALAAVNVDGNGCYFTPQGYVQMTCNILNHYRQKYLETKTKPMKDEKARQELMKKYWWQMIQLLPSSYNQRRTVMLNYEVLANIYKSRRNHKLDEWSIGFINWIKSLPYSELITGSKVINDAQNALEGPKFADTATFEENKGICKGEDKNPVDALFDVIYGLNAPWFKKDKNNGKK